MHLSELFVRVEAVLHVEYGGFLIPSFMARVRSVNNIIICLFLLN